MFAWEAYERGSEVHLQADPTKLELLHQSFKVKKEDFKDKERESILERVGFWAMWFKTPLLHTHILMCKCFMADKTV